MCVGDRERGGSVEIIEEKREQACTYQKTFIFSGRKKSCEESDIVVMRSKMC